MTVRAYIDLGALRHNLDTLKQAIHPARCMLVVKADAYGHGLLPVAQTACEAGVYGLGTLDITNALLLRENGINLPLFAWLHGTPAQWKQAIETDIDLGVSHLNHLERITACEASRPANIHLKIDTGLHRNGTTLEHWPEFVRHALELERKHIVHIRGIWSHLADTSVQADLESLNIFHTACEQAKQLGITPELIHIAASSAGLYLPQARFDMVRFGLVAYGISTLEHVTEAELNILPVLRLETDVVWIAPDKKTLKIGIGFGDGLTDVDTSRAWIMFKKTRCKIIDIEVDTLKIEAPEGDICIGEPVRIFDDDFSGESFLRVWASWSETTEDEVLTRLSSRVKRIYTDSK